MSIAKDYLKEDFERKPEELEREANDVRVDMERTIDQLMSQLSPGELINQALDRFKNGGDSAFTRNLMNQVQNNPVPAVLAGCSLAWLMAASKQPPPSADHGRVGEAKDKMSSVAGSARSMGHDAKHSTQGMKEQAGATASHLKEQMSEASHQTAESARHGARAAQQSYDELLREQPLLMGALAVAAGAAIGAMLPASSAENKMVGQTSDNKTEELKAKAQHKMEESQKETTASSQERSAQERPTQGEAKVRSEEHRSRPSPPQPGPSSP